MARAEPNQQSPGKTVLLGLAYFLGGTILAPSLGPVLAPIAIFGGLLYAISGVIDAFIDAWAKPASKTEPKIGDRRPDGITYAGISPDTQKPMYATHFDASPATTFNEANKSATTGKDLHVPHAIGVSSFHGGSSRQAFNQENEAAGPTAGASVPDRLAAEEQVIRKPNPFRQKPTP